MTYPKYKILRNIGIGALVIGLGAVVYRQEMGIGHLLEMRHSLLAEARTRGIGIAPNSSRVTKRNRGRTDPLQSARSLAADLVRRADAGPGYRTDGPRKRL